MSVKLTNITKAFGEKTVIKNFSLNIEKGGRLALVSPSGSGKTTLFRIISGLEKRFDGERLVKGNVSFMFQEDRLFETSTVLENVLAVAEKKVDEAKELLEKLALGDYIDAYPADLSGGMRRRVALARTLIYDADIFLLDECFTGLDEETRESVAEVINFYTKGKTLLLITHDKTEAELLDAELLITDTYITKK